MAEVVVYSRRGCHLCEVLIEELLPLCRGRAEVVVRDVDTRAGWRERYGDDVPVVEIGGLSVCRHRLDREAVDTALAAAG